ncbi:MAG TPA: hypothetical protein VNN18_11370 [Candidatus Xenobia bacterium]|nr:hypothetical protein [Candidatus Xenobia bacterium]
MKWVLLALVGLAALAVAVFYLRRALARSQERAAHRREFRKDIESIRAALAEFEKSTDIDDQIRLLADITRYAANGFRLFPDHPEIMNIVRACEDERRKLVQHWVVGESRRLMKFVEESTNLRVKAGRADQVAECIKVASRYLFPHEAITSAMRAVVQYQEALEGILELPEAEREATAEGAKTLLEPYFRIMQEMDQVNAELARVPWKGDEIRRLLTDLERL